MRSSDGCCHTAGGLWLRPRDVMKIARLVLDGGAWRDRQIVPAAWIRDATSLQVHVPDTAVGPPRATGYGHHWWLLDSPTAGGTVRSVSAVGIGGQAVHVVPDLELAVVATSTDWSAPDRTTGPLLDAVLGAPA